MNHTFTSEEIDAINAMPTIGYWSTLSGVEVKKMEFGINDYMVCVSGTFIGQRRYHRLRIHYTNPSHAESRAYVVLDGCRLYLDTCIRN